MRITFFGLTLSSSWGNGHATPYRALIRALSLMSHEVTFFERDSLYYARHRDFTECDYCDLVIYPDWEAVRGTALDVAIESDVVITASYLPEGARINDEILNLAGASRAPMKIFYDLDTPITLADLRKGDLEYLRKDQIPNFDLYLSFTGGKILNELDSKWQAKRAAPLYGCVDPDVHHRVDVPLPYHCFFSYMGTYAEDRQKKVEDLFLSPAAAMPGELFVLAGSLYPHNPADGSPTFPCPHNVRRFPHVGPPDHGALYSSSRATLNITRGEMASAGYCPSGRLFEAAACGTPILTDTWQGLEDFYDLEKELFVVQDTESVIDILRLPIEELQRRAQGAKARTLEEHTGKRRAEELMNAIESVSPQSKSQTVEAMP